MKISIPIDDFQINAQVGVSTIKLERFSLEHNKQIYILMINDKLHKLRIYQDEIEDAKMIKAATHDDLSSGKANSFITRVSVGFWNYFSGSSTPRQTPEKNIKMKVDKKLNSDQTKNDIGGEVSVIRLSISSERNQLAIYFEKDKVFTDFRILDYYER